jgi:hypothetical protein
MSSDQPNARQMFGVNALFNDQTLEMIRCPSAATSISVLGDNAPAYHAHP